MLAAVASLSALPKSGWSDFLRQTNASAATNNHSDATKQPRRWR